ncbi:MAG TPA: hypothetical protein VI299_25920, partial [Polyangiales bacterium]
AYDHRARLLGLFRAGELIGGMRLVFRSEQRLALVVRSVRAVIEDVVAEERTSALPSEGAFDLANVLGVRHGLVDVEVGRFVVRPAAVGPRVVLRMMVATLAVLVQLGARYYVYSCGAAMARRYAIVAKPRWTFEGNEHSGIHADGFVFPKLSCAGVASVEDSPYLEQALRYAAEFALTGSIALSASLAGEPSTADVALPMEQ